MLCCMPMWHYCGLVAALHRYLDIACLSLPEINTALFKDTNGRRCQGGMRLQDLDDPRRSPCECVAAQLIFAFVLVDRLLIRNVIEKSV
ncbi:hypothetical protein M430DRAFT_233422 [Amorphotheca resinae ATCC 22711]|jgi:hypothetical protein|uniref:AMP-dependent synthetase/ligase domain-containing protein n=1 Tax=Amorphotheca resinae ATCC 22711 TaxID=857342 RepID=A0A2T3B448_AMORE|nr:hypothetical protein M430DRAFT_233422 [Amorphotheca resinae ATCC 22711]PSS20398.1 hypothetical protein M430DRAFT_233422 [Amorphotheca resinae ATCC 22711]